MSANQLPVCGASFSWTDVEREIDWLQESGRDLELNAGHAVLDNDVGARIDSARRLLDGFTGRLSIHAPGGIRCATDDPLEREFTRTRFTQAVDFAAAIGASHMVIEPWLFSFSNATIQPPHMPGMADRAYDTLAPVVEHAARHGVVLTMENVPEVNPALLIGLIRRFDSPGARMCLDTGHAFLMHHQHGAPVPDVWVREAGDLLVHIHVADNDGEMDRHWAPGDGRIAWYPVFEALKTLTDMPRLILELPPARAKKGAEFFARSGYAR